MTVELEINIKYDGLIMTPNPSRLAPRRRALLFLGPLFFALSLQAGAVEEIDFPEGFGKVNEVFDADPERTIVIIQDAHRNYECQLNTVEIFNSIETRQNIPLLALEGAQGGFITDLFVHLPDRQLNQDIALHFLKEGRITSPEYFAIVSDAGKDTELFGVEDPALYLENLAAFKKAYGLAQELSNSLSQVKEVIHQLKSRIYSKRLNNLDDLLESYQRGTLSFKDYLRKLLEWMGEKGGDLKGFKQILTQSEILDLEDQIRFPLLDQERSSLMNAITQKLPPKILSQLLVQSLQFRMNRISALRYHEFLWKLAKDYQLPEAQYPNLKLYLEYIRKISEISEPHLFQELSQWIRSYQDHLIQTSEERRLDDLSHRVDLIERLFRLRVSNEDYRGYVEHKQEFTWDKLIPLLKELGESKELDLFFPSEFKRLDEALPVIESFYEMALKRDAVMLEKTLQRMEEKKYPFAILIAGGFHTEGIAKILKEKAISYRVVTPKVTLRNAQTPYFSLLLNEKNPIERWVEPVSLSALEPQKALDAKPMTYLDVQLVVLRLYAAYLEGGRLLDAATRTGGVTLDEVNKTLVSAKALNDRAFGTDFKADFARALSPRPGVLQIPIFKRNEKGEVVQAYILMSRGAGARETIESIRNAQGLIERVGDTLKSSQGDISYGFVEQDAGVAERQRQARDEELARWLKERLGVDAAEAQGIFDDLLMSDLSLEALGQTFVKAGVTVDTKDLNKAKQAVDILYEAAVSETDFDVVSKLYQRLQDVFKEALLGKPALANEIRSRRIVAEDARLANIEKGKELAADYSEFFSQASAIGVLTSLFFDPAEVRDGKFFGKVSPRAGEVVAAFKNLMANLSPEARKNFRLVLINLDKNLPQGIYPAVANNILGLLGLPRQVSPENPVHFVGLQEVLSQLSVQQQGQSELVTQALYQVVQKKAEVDKGEVSILAMREEALQLKLKESIVFVLEDAARNQMLSAPEALKLLAEARKLGRLGIQSSDEEFVNRLVKSFEGILTREQVVEGLRQGVLSASPSPIETVNQNEIDGMMRELEEADVMELSA